MLFSRFSLLLPTLVIASLLACVSHYAGWEVSSLHHLRVSRYPSQGQVPHIFEVYVKSLAGDPIDGAEVSVISPSGGLGGHLVLTDEDGRAEIGPFPSGRGYSLKVQASGYRTAQWNYLVLRHGFSEYAFEATLDEDIDSIYCVPSVCDHSLTPDAGLLQGIISDTSGKPIGGAVVSIKSVALIKSGTRVGWPVYGPTLRSATDSKGRYCFCNLTPSDYFMGVKAEGYYITVPLGPHIKGGQKTTLDVVMKIGSNTITLECGL